MRKFVAFVAFLIMGSGPVLADGEPGSLKDVPGVAVVDEWSGFSVGVGGGAGKIDQNLFADAWRKDWAKTTTCSWWWWWCFSQHKHDSVELDRQVKQDDWNGFGTVQVGYDRVIANRILIGAFADFDFYPDSDQSFSETQKYGKHGSATLAGNISEDGIWTVGGRLGVLVTPRLLIYGLGGYSQMNLQGDVTADFTDPFYSSGSPYALPSSLKLKLPDHLNGWTVGGGFETKLDRLDKRLSLKIEYRFSHFDGDELSISDSDYVKGVSCSWWGVTSTKHGFKDKLGVELDDSDVQSVRAVLVWKLQPEPQAVAALK